MKKILSLVAVLLLSFVFFSCESKRDENGDLLFGLDEVPIDQGGPGVTKKLTKVTEKDADGELTTVTYTYEGDKIKKAVLVGEDATETLDVVYNGNVLKEFTSTSTDASGQPIKANFTLVYEGQNLKKITGVYNQATTIVSKATTDYSYNSSDKLIKVLTTINAVDPDNQSDETLSTTIESDLLYSNLNVTKWRLDTKQYMDLGSGPVMMSNIVVETNFMNFDTNKNPFSTLPIDFIRATCNLADGFGGFNGISANNFSKATAVVMGMNQVLNFTYAYDGDGYVTKRTGDDGSVVTYEYK